MAVSQKFSADLLSAIPGLRAFGISLTSRADWADDLVQETLMKAWKHHESFQAGSNMNAWLYTILRNEFYSQWRKRKREVEDGEGHYSGRVATQAEQHGHLDIKNLSTALQLLPEDQREAILLVGASGFSYEEAAVICNVALGTIKSRVSRARIKLGKILDIESEEDLKSDPRSQAGIKTSPVVPT